MNAPPPPDPQSVLQARARELARPQGDGDPPGDGLEVLELRLARDRYALETRHVAEVVPLADLAPVPCTPAFIRGVINVRGRLLAVLDLQRFLQLPAQGLHDLHHVLLVRGGGLEFGVLADHVLGVRRLPRASLQPAWLEGPAAQALQGMTPDGLLVLAFERVLADPRLTIEEEVDP